MSESCLITGGAQGIGLCIARELIQRRYHVVIADRDAEALEELKDEFGGSALLVEADVSRESQMRTLAARLRKAELTMSGLVNNAGIGCTKPVTELSLGEWNRVLAVNLTSVFLTAKHITPLMGRGGAVVSIASTRAVMSEADTEAYSASKGAVAALTHSLAVSLGPRIRVNAVSPGWIDVSNIKKASDRRPEKITREDHAQHPSGRVGRGSDVACLTAFLLSPEAEFITGQNYVIDGGMTRKMIYC